MSRPAARGARADSPRRIIDMPQHLSPNPARGVGRQISRGLPCFGGPPIDAGADVRLLGAERLRLEGAAPGVVHARPRALRRVLAHPDPALRAHPRRCSPNSVRVWRAAIAGPAWRRSCTAAPATLAAFPGGVR